MNNGLSIFYALQGTGNGHIERAMELLPYLQQYGNVDVFLSGSNSNLDAALLIKYRSEDISLYYGNRGGLAYWKMWKELNFSRIYKEAKALPLEKYDVVINDFDSITSMACKLKISHLSTLVTKLVFKVITRPAQPKKIEWANWF